MLRGLVRSRPRRGRPDCPETVDAVGGVGFYDGSTNPGFQALKAELWAAMEAGGFDIVDAEGNVNVAAPGAPGGVSPACLGATPHDIGMVEHIGISLAGVPITGDPPSVKGQGAGDPRGDNIPAIGGCDGHIDPREYLHWHLGPEEANSVLNVNGIDDVRCTAC